jgi:hypothetical protein
MAGFGLRPVRHLTGAPYNGQFNEYVHIASDNAAIGLGSPVKLTGVASPNEAGKNLPTVAVGTAGAALVGVCVGVKPVTADSLKYCAASTLRTIYVADAPDLIFEVQEDAAGGAVALASVGLNANQTAESVDTVTGMSTVELDSSDVATDTTGQLRIHRLSEKVGNAALATAAPLAIWEVFIAEHQLGQATTGIGTDI